MLHVRGLDKSYGGLRVVADVDLDVEEGSIVGLIGPNGAGKTTCFNLISGFVRPDRGSVRFDGIEIVGSATHTIVRRGLVRTFQQAAVFAQATVLTNISQGAHLHDGTRFWGAIARTPGANERSRTLHERALAVLARLGLTDLAGVRAGALPYGQQKKLGIGIAMAAAPRLLMLDEPVAGLNATESAEIVRMIQQLRSDGVTVLLVEHDMRTVMSLCDRIVVLSEGAKIAEGSPAAIREHPEVVRVYLGTGLAAGATVR